MEIKDILALANAGFTADQIARFDAALKAEPEVAANNTPAQEKAEEPKQEAAQEQPKANPEADMMKAMMDRFDALTQQMQQAAIRGSEQPPKQSVDDILASVINPPMKNKEV